MSPRDILPLRPLTLLFLLSLLSSEKSDSWQGKRVDNSNLVVPVVCHLVTSCRCARWHCCSCCLCCRLKKAIVEKGNELATVILLSQLHVTSWHPAVAPVGTVVHVVSVVVWKNTAVDKEILMLLFCGWTITCPLVYWQHVTGETSCNSYDNRKYRLNNIKRLRVGHNL